MVERLIVVGSSAGGYAAMLLGELTDADEVHAFSPQTFIGKDAFHQHREPRWSRETRRMHDEGTFRPRYAELAACLGSAPEDRRTVHHVYFDPNSRPDAVHAGCLRDCRRVHLHALPSGDHDVAAILARRGELTPIIQSAVDSGVPVVPGDEVSHYTMPARVPASFRARRRAWIARNWIEVKLGLSPKKYF